MEELTVLSSSNSSLTLSWEPPTQGHDLSTGFRLTCTPLLVGIPPPRSLNSTGGDFTNLTLSGLYSGVSYNCSVVTLTAEGESESRNIVQTTEETGAPILCIYIILYHLTDFSFCSTAPSGTPLSLQVVVGVTEIAISWSPPEVTLRNGMIIGYTLSCSPNDSAVVTLMITTFTEAGSHTVDGFLASTDYNCSIVATNRVGTGPPARISFTTQTEGESLHIN